jgi:hypothetical protein
VLLLMLVACSYLPRIPGCGPDQPGGPTGPVSITPPKPKIEIGSGSTAAAPSPSDPDAPAEAIDKNNCADVQDGGPVQGPACITQVVKCNSVVYGNTIGGTQNFDSKFYETHRCTPRTTNHDSGDERVYLLDTLEGEHRVKAWLDTPCADLDLTVMTVPERTSCPANGDNILKICDMWPRPNKEREQVELSTQGKTNIMFVVEGKNEEEGSFALTIQCSDGLY